MQVPDQIYSHNINFDKTMFNYVKYIYKTIKLAFFEDMTFPSDSDVIKVYYCY